MNDCFQFVHLIWCLSLWWYSDITQSLAKVWQFVPLAFSLFQLLSPCCLVMLLSSLLPGAGWIHKLNIAVITLEFIIRYLVSELGYLKKRAASFQAGIRFWQLLAEGCSEVTPVYLLQAGLFFFLLLPFSHVFSDSQPPTLRSAGTSRDDFVIRWCFLDDPSFPCNLIPSRGWYQASGTFGNGLSCTHLRGACSKWPKSLKVSKQSPVFSSGPQNMSYWSARALLGASPRSVLSSPLASPLVLSSSLQAGSRSRVCMRHPCQMTSNVYAAPMLSLLCPSLVSVCLVCEISRSRIELKAQFWGLFMRHH